MSAPTDGASNGRTEETIGMITSDSLAAESLKSGGDFASGNAVASQQPSYSTTSNVTDTSGASVLPPAPDAPTRDTDESYIPPLNSSSSGSAAGATSGVYDTSKGGPQESDGGAAPSYVSTVTDAAQSNESQQPKGKNITEGGFDANAPNASFQDNIGTRNDPGRQGEMDMQKANAKSGADAGYPNASIGADGGGGKGGFEKLADEPA